MQQNTIVKITVFDKQINVFLLLFAKMIPTYRPATNYQIRNKIQTKFSTVYRAIGSQKIQFISRRKDTREKKPSRFMYKCRMKYYSNTM